MHPSKGFCDFSTVQHMIQAISLKGTPWQRRFTLALWICPDSLYDGLSNGAPFVLDNYVGNYVTLSMVRLNMATQYLQTRKVDSQLQSRIRRHVPKDSFLIYNCVPRKLKRHSSQNQNADIRHLLDSLVSALAVYATAFRSKHSLE